MSKLNKSENNTSMVVYQFIIRVKISITLLTIFALNIYLDEIIIYLRHELQIMLIGQISICIFNIKK
jgi:hypothetical protein